MQFFYFHLQFVVSAKWAFLENIARYQGIAYRLNGFLPTAFCAHIGARWGTYRHGSSHACGWAGRIKWGEFLLRLYQATNRRNKARNSNAALNIDTLIATSQGRAS